jgi:hypothetical protein
MIGDVSPEATRSIALLPCAEVPIIGLYGLYPSFVISSCSRILAASKAAALVEFSSWESFLVSLDSRLWLGILNIQKNSEITIFQKALPV